MAKVSKAKLEELMSTFGLSYLIPVLIAGYPIDIDTDEEEVFSLFIGENTKELMNIIGDSRLYIGNLEIGLRTDAKGLIFMNIKSGGDVGPTAFPKAIDFIISKIGDLHFNRTAYNRDDACVLNTVNGKISMINNYNEALSDLKSVTYAFKTKITEKAIDESSLSASLTLKVTIKEIMYE